VGIRQEHKEHCSVYFHLFCTRNIVQPVF